MATVSTSFTAVGASAETTVPPGQSVDYAVSGTFSGTVVLQRQNGAGWDTVASASAAASGNTANESKGDMRFRFVCTAYTSGTIVTSIADAEDTTVEYKRPDGTVWFRLKDNILEFVTRPVFRWIYEKRNVAARRSSANAAGDATSTALATITLPKNILAGSNSVYVHAFFRSTNSANTKTFAAKVGGTTIGSTTATTNVGVQLSIPLHADNAANDQKAVNSAAAGWDAAGGTVLDIAKDGTGALDITIECNWAGATAAETIDLESYMVEVLPGTPA